MRIVQKVSNVMFAHKICLQVSGTKYPVISNRYQVKVGGKNYLVRTTTTTTTTKQTQHNRVLTSS